MKQQLKGVKISPTAACQTLQPSANQNLKQCLIQKRPVFPLAPILENSLRNILEEKYFRRKTDILHLRHI